MKKVEFVRVKSELSGYGFSKGMKYCFTGIENIIKDRLMDGWSFEGYVPVETRGIGDIETPIADLSEGAVSHHDEKANQRYCACLESEWFDRKLKYFFVSA